MHRVELINHEIVLRAEFASPATRAEYLERFPYLHGELVHIQSSDSDKTLYAVLDAGYRPSDIEVSGLGLEQAFLAITAEDDRAAGGQPARPATKQTARGAR